MSSLTQNILGGIWGFNPQTFHSLMPVLLHFIQNGVLPTPSTEQVKLNIEASQNAFYPVNGDSFSEKDEFYQTMDLKGAIIKYDEYCGAEGTLSKSKKLDLAFSTERDMIKGVVLHVDSGGGEARATPEIIEVLQKRNKPVIALVDDMACSAAYDIVSNCDKVVLRNEMSIVGSIGTYITIFNIKDMLEKQGVKMMDVYADASVQKNEAFRNAMEGDFSLLKSELLNPINDLFVNRVKSARGNLINEEYEKDVFEGAVFMGQKAIDSGLADSFGNLESCFQLIDELS